MQRRSRNYIYFLWAFILLQMAVFGGLMKMALRVADSAQDLSSSLTDKITMTKDVAKRSIAQTDKYKALWMRCAGVNKMRNKK